MDENTTTDTGTTNAKRPVALKLSAIAAQLPDMASDGTNQHQGYSYLSASKIFSELRQRLGEAGVAVIPTVKKWDVMVGETSAGKPTNIVTAEFVYDFVDGESGDTLSATFATQAMDSGDKAASKAATQALKYVLRQIFLIADNGEDLEVDSIEAAAIKPQPKAGRSQAARTSPAKTGEVRNLDLNWDDQTLTVTGRGTFDIKENLKAEFKARFAADVKGWQMPDHATYLAAQAAYSQPTNAAPIETVEATSAGGSNDIPF